MDIHPASILKKETALEINIQVIAINDNDYASGFSLSIPDELTIEHLEYCLTVLDSTKESMRKIIERL